MLQAATLNFLKKIKKNNNKAWLDAHRSDYEIAKKDFEQFIQSLIDSHSKKDPGLKGLLAKGAIFRINRDVRFSKDKSPYKIHMGAYMCEGGKKSPLAGYYFHLEPGNSFAGGGIWMPSPENLKKIRQEIDYNLPELKKIVGSKKFKSIYGELSREGDYSLTRVPKGYSADDPAAEFLKLKSLVAMVEVTDKDILSGQLLRKTQQAFEALQPFNEFINHSIR